MKIPDPVRKAFSRLQEIRQGGDMEIIYGVRRECMQVSRRIKDERLVMDFVFAHINLDTEILQDF